VHPPKIKKLNHKKIECKKRCKITWRFAFHQKDKADQNTSHDRAFHLKLGKDSQKRVTPLTQHICSVDIISEGMNAFSFLD